MQNASSKISLFIWKCCFRNNFSKKSDIDFLYEYDLINYPDWIDGEFDLVTNFFSLKEKLEKMLQRNIDLIPNQEFKNPYFKASIEKSKTLIYNVA